MIEVKNKLSNFKEKRKYKWYSKYFKIKKNIRLKLKKIKPLSQHEEIIYREDNKKMKATKLNKEKYFENNGEINILSVIPKTEINDLYYGIVKLIKNNPRKGYSPFYTEKDLYNAIYTYKNTNNSNSYSYIGLIAPNDTDLKNVVENITIMCFDFSDDYIGISFKINLIDDIKKEINLSINGDVDFNETYEKYYIGKKKKIVKFEWNPDITRMNNLNDVLVEIKMRVHKFLSKYIQLFPLQGRAPISLDTYITNLDFNKFDFLSSYDIYNIEKHLEYEDFPIIYRNKGKSDEFTTTKCLFECSDNRKNINRSVKLIMYKENYEQEMSISQEDSLNLYILILYFYYLNDLEKIISSERDKLTEIYNKSEKKVYKVYCIISKKILPYKQLFNNISYCKNYFLNDRIKHSYEFQESRYNKLMDKHKEIEVQFNNKMLVSNYLSTYNLAKMSIFIAFISILISCVITYSNNTKYSIDDIMLKLDEIKKDVLVNHNSVEKEKDNINIYN